MDAVTLLCEQAQRAHSSLEEIMNEVTPEQAHWNPPGVANPLGATYAHILLSEDRAVNAVLKGGGQMAATTWAGKMGLSEPPPPFGRLAPWNDWARRVRIDLDGLRRYAQAVYRATDDYLTSLRPEDLEVAAEYPPGMAGRTMGWVVSNIVVAHGVSHCGEIACLKGLQGVRGLPV